MPHPPPFGDATLSLHAGQQPDPTHGSAAPPIQFTGGFVFANSAQAAGRHNLEEAGHADPHLSNPTVAVLEERIAALEGGVGAVATASGQAALHLAIATLMGAGGHIVAALGLDSAAHALLGYTLPRFGITTHFIDGRDPAAWRTAIRPETRLLVAPSLGDPGLAVADIPTIAGIAHDHGLPLLVDATLATPALHKPLDLGADLVVHAAGPFLGGHGVALGGLLVDGGRFVWTAGRPFPTLTDPWPGFHGINCAEESPVAAFLLRARWEGLAAFGTGLSPMNAFQVLQGLETLPLRMAAHSDQALAVALHLAEQALVERVAYPGLASHPDHALAARLLPAGCGAVLSFDLRGGQAAARAFLDALRLVGRGSAAGAARSTASHPATTTHARFPATDPIRAEIGPGTLRLAVGLESLADILQDLERGLYAVAKTLEA